MSVHHPHLRKALQLCMLHGRSLDSALRSDIRDSIRRAEGGRSGGGGDFHGVFWADAKSHALGAGELPELVDERIESNRRRRRLYPRLRDQFLEWWGPFRAQTNQPIRPVESPLCAEIALGDTGVLLKLHNLLSISAGPNFRRHIYPYFSEEPPLAEEVASYGIWALSQAFPDHTIHDFVLLDVLRARGFTAESNPDYLDAAAIFEGRYQMVLNRWEVLRGEY